MLLPHSPAQFSCPFLRSGQEQVPLLVNADIVARDSDYFREALKHRDAVQHHLHILWLDELRSEALERCDRRQGGERIPALQDYGV
jgi:hypothetical protein